MIIGQEICYLIAYTSNFQLNKELKTFLWTMATGPRVAPLFGVPHKILEILTTPRTEELPNLQILELSVHRIPLTNNFRSLRSMSTNPISGRPDPVPLDIDEITSPNLQGQSINSHLFNLIPGEVGAQAAAPILTSF